MRKDKKKDLNSSAVLESKTWPLNLGCNCIPKKRKPRWRIITALCLCLLNRHASSFPLSLSNSRISVSLHFANDKEVMVYDTKQSKTSANGITIRQPSIKKPLLPPWIPGSNEGDEELTRAQMKNNLHVLNQALEQHAKFSNPPGSFSKQDIDTVMDAVFVASKNNQRLVPGAADFLTLLLSMEEYNSDCAGDEDGDDDEYYRYGDEQDAQFHAVMTRDALVASAFHYADCVIAREAGIYDLIDNLMRSTTTATKALNGAEQTLPFGVLNTKKDLRNQADLTLFISPSEIKSDFKPSTLDVGTDADFLSSAETGEDVVLSAKIDEYKRDPDERQNVQRDRDRSLTISGSKDAHNGGNRYPSVEDFGSEATKISKSAARVKQAEIMSHSVLPTTVTRATPSLADAASLHGLLLSISEDWRALAIRSTACLYRLRGLLYHEHSSSLSFYGLSAESGSLGNYSNSHIVREAREALYVYAPIAERLGMHRLKSELENGAFRVLYRRQYNTAKAIYTKSGAAIQSVTDYLTENIEIVLKDDPWLAPQLERLTVTSRVKKPYSLWRKLLKMNSKSRNADREERNSSALSVIDPDTLSITSVLDAIAMRVIVKAKKAENEGVENVRSREEFLCYYIQNRLMQKWPVVDNNRIKDYISTPKPNGYQSLHHTSELYRYGCCWPFEVQIRTEDMHTKSEFGVAAHWDYKLEGGKSPKRGSLPILEGVADLPERDSPVLVIEGDDDSTTSTLQDYLPIADISDIRILEKGSEKLNSLNRSSMLKSYIDAMSKARVHLIDSSVFVFYLTSDSAMEGKVIRLPIESSVADALIEICERCDLSVPKSLVFSDLDVYLNGSIANLHDTVHTGDALIVPALGKRVQTFLSL